VACVRKGYKRFVNRGDVDEVKESKLRFVFNLI